MSQSFDLIVVGAGPGGYVAAIRGAQLGMRVALIEKAALGGVCLNWGCIPTKTLLRTAEIYHTLHRLKEFGLSADNISFDLDAIIDRSRKVSKQLASGISHLMKKNKVTVFMGTAKLLGQRKVEVSGIGTLSAAHIILATGARPRILPGLEPDGKLIWTSKEAMTPNVFPKKLLIVGSGAIGIEFASFYKTMGAEVYVVELQDRILPVEDAEISILARQAFEKQGIKFYTASKVSGLEKGKDIVKITIEGAKKEMLEVDRVLVAAGIQGNVENLGLENTKCTVEKGQIWTDAWCATNEPGLYAIGDVAGAPWLAHKASHEAVICVEKIKGMPDVRPLDKTRIPGCTYSMPQIASIGLTEDQAKVQGKNIKVGRFPYMANGKAIALGETEGLVKTIFDANTGELLGVHMIGAEVTELIQGFVVAKTLETTEVDLMHTVFPHPTLSEMMHESVLDAYKKALHF